MNQAAEQDSTHTTLARSRTQFRPISEGRSGSYFTCREMTSSTDLHIRRIFSDDCLSAQFAKTEISILRCQRFPQRQPTQSVHAINSNQKTVSIILANVSKHQRIVTNTHLFCAAQHNTEHFFNVSHDGNALLRRQRGSDLLLEWRTFVPEINRHCHRWDLRC